MRRKTMLLAAAALSAMAVAALPASASAAPELHTTPALSPVSPAQFPLAYSGSGGAGTLFTASGPHIECQLSVTSGEFTDAHTGTAVVNFHNCRESTLNSTCASVDPTTGKTDASGTITTKWTTHSVYLEPANPADPQTRHERPGILLELEDTLTIKCLSDFITIQVRGGVLGTVDPGIGTDTSTFTIDVTADTVDGQQHTTFTDSVTNENEEIVEYTTEEVGLESNVNGGAFEPAYLNAGSQEVEFAEQEEKEVKATTTTGT
jgi:hypothetical protein